MNRQQRRAIERANAKHPPKVINPSAMQLCITAALHPTLWRPASTPVQSIAIEQTTPATSEAQPNASSNAAAGQGVKKLKTCSKCRKLKPIEDFNSNTKPCKACIELSRRQQILNTPKEIKEQLALYERARQATATLISAEAEKRAQAVKKAVADNPPQEHPRHPSGWPKNPFTGLRRGGGRDGGARGVKAITDELEAA